jgi:TPR repeat protein
MTLARQGNWLGQACLDKLFAEGKGVPQDKVTAHMWFSIAVGEAPNDSEEPRIRLETLTVEMTPAEISEAQRRARVCLESHYQDCG